MVRAILLDRTVTWTQKNANWKELLTLPVVDLDAKIVKVGSSGNEMAYRVHVKNLSSVPAVNVMLELTDGLFGKEILPAFWNDNALTLMPGETKTVEVRVRKELLPDEAGLVAGGLNVTPASWDISTGLKKEMEFNIENLNIQSHEDQNVLYFSATPLTNYGTRITTGPVKLSIDGKLLRYVSVAVKPGMDITGRVELPALGPGKHEVQMGKALIEVILQ